MHASRTLTRLSMAQRFILSAFQRTRKASHFSSIHHGHADIHPPRTPFPIPTSQLRTCTVSSLPSIHDRSNSSPSIRRYFSHRAIYSSHHVSRPTHEPANSTQRIPERSLLLPTQRSPTLCNRQPKPSLAALRPRARTVLRHRPSQLPPPPRAWPLGRPVPFIPPRWVRLPGSRACRAWFHRPRLGRRRWRSHVK